MNPKKSEDVRAMAAYIAVGVATTLVNFLLFYLMNNILQWETNISNTISVASSILFAYICNKRLVFRSKTQGAAKLFLEIAAFFSSRLLTMLIEIGGVFVFCTVMQFDPIVIKIIINVIVIILNYLLSRYFVFKK